MCGVCVARRKVTKRVSTLVGGPPQIIGSLVIALVNIVIVHLNEVSCLVRCCSASSGSGIGARGSFEQTRFCDKHCRDSKYQEQQEQDNEQSPRTSRTSSCWPRFNTPESPRNR